ncbi:hypothetical protein [Geminocystis sp. GBBB08]|uniref:hypothetical protein n=1 Tax=Geminocystis sp. GBBB08 TaxID=2604140 RepID=UPI0027E32422|nr:hypothetical protein [Geminocystis sp. GBBB08]MBL1209431.1 hypothetical protein [Geminocystis sp. GBBB08]
MKKNTPILNSKLPRFRLHLLLGLSSFLVSPFITLFTGQSAIVSANTEIIVDPYNDSNFEPLPINGESIKTNSSNKNKLLPTGNQNNTIGEILIKGNPTPQPPAVVSGNLIKSNQTLPQIPPLSEPYRKPNINNEINQNSPDNEKIQGKITTVSDSISPFDQTPNDNQPNLLETKTIKPSNNINTTPRSINLSPNAFSSPNNNPNNDENINTSSPQQTTPNLGRRRSLNEILVFSTPPENNFNTSTVTATTSINQASSLSITNNSIHKVLVKINNSAQESQVRSLYPEAFRTNLRGEQMLQVGVFTHSDTAQGVSNSLKNIGLNAVIIKN